MSQPRPTMGTLDFVAHSNPQGLAIVAGDLRRTWDEWNERACRLASYLRDRYGLKQGDRVAWMLPNSPAYYDLAFAAQKLGVGPVSVPYRLTGSEAAYIIADSDARVVLADADSARRLAEARDEIDLPDENFIVADGDSPRADALPHAVALEAAIAEGSPERFLFQGDRPAGPMVYTSGTTGKPKGAVRSMKGRDPMQIRMYHMGMTMALGFKPGNDVHLLCCPLYHSAPPIFANIAQVMGGRVVIMPKFDAEGALRLIAEEKVTSTFMVPTMLRRIAALPQEVKDRYDTRSMKRLLTGGAPCPQDLKQKVMATFASPCLYEFYGSTETAVVTIIKPDEHEAKPGSCGKVVQGCEARVLDDDGNELPTGEAGLLYVKNPLIVSGYHKNDDATDAAMRDGFFCVGDVARFDEDGFCYLVDRKNDMIISGGVNIYPAEVEAELRKHPAIYDCGVFGVPNEEWGEEVKAVVQLNPGAELTEDALMDFLADRLAGFKRPRSVDFMAELPYSPTGKLLKKDLRKPYWAATDRTI